MSNRTYPFSLKKIIKTNWLLLLGIGLVGANLRVPLTSVGALIPFIRDDLGINNTIAGAITTLPLLAFAILSPFAPKIANRIGMNRTIALSLILLIIGIAIRSLFGISLIFVGTLFIGLAIAVGNVLIPAIVKINFPLQIGLMTGIYAIFMNVFAAIGTGFSIPIAEVGRLGWRGSIGIWILLAIFTLAVWMPQIRGEKKSSVTKVTVDNKTNLWRSPLAWQVTFFMGCQSFIYYVNVAWLPDILISKGYDANVAGWIVFILLAVFIPFTFIMPIVAEKLTNQVGLSVATGGLFILGYLAVFFGSSVFVFIGAIMLGTANGSSFGLAMMFFTLRTKDGVEAAELSGMAQSIGYLLAAVGPVIIGALYDLTNEWFIPFCLLLIMAILILLNGVAAGKDRQVSDETFAADPGK